MILDGSLAADVFAIEVQGDPQRVMKRIATNALDRMVTVRIGDVGVPVNEPPSDKP